MPKTKKVLLPLNLIDYDVYIEDRTATSDEYFQISRLSSVFTGGKNSFLIAGSSLLQDNSEILIEILDNNKNTIYQTIVANYSEADSKMLSVDIYDTTPSGPAYIVMMGKATRKADGTEIPFEWQNVYNVRWIRKVIVDYDVNNISPVVFQNNPEILVTENRFLGVISSSYTTQTASISASLTPSLFSSVQSGYSIKAFNILLSSSYINPIVTGSLTIDGNTKVINLPLTKVLNNAVGYTYGYYLQSPISNDSIIKAILLKSGSYVTNIGDTEYPITSSAVLQYSTLNTSSTNEPVSYANVRISNLNTVSGELYKIRIYSKVATSVSNYKLVADVPVISEELLITSSARGNFSIGNIAQSPTVTSNWYAGELTQNVGAKNIAYPVSGTLAYYVPTAPSNQFGVVATDNVLLSALSANIPITASSPFQTISSTTLTSSRYTTQASESGYFIGTTQYVNLFPTTEYTLQLDAYYKKTSASCYLDGITPKVDIYIVGITGNVGGKLLNDNPLGQKIGELTVSGEVQWFEQKQFNFVPTLSTLGSVGLRFIISNGFWYFSNISLKPASDPQFSPDEIQVLIPNTEYHNELLEYKAEFFNINNSSAPVSAVSVPTFFTGSSIDLGTIL